MMRNILLGCSLFILIACNLNGTAAAIPTDFTAGPTPTFTASLAGPAATKLPPTRQNARQVPVAPLGADLQTTLEAGLPPTATPDGSGFSEHGFAGVTILPLEPDQSDQTLWAAFTTGFISYDPWQPYYVAIYARRNEAWSELGRLELTEPFFLGANSVRQVFVETSRIWLEVNSGIGAHGGCYDLLSFDGETLRSEVSHCHESPGAGQLTDLNQDGVLEVLLDRTTNYVFCYACGVRLINYQVFRWDGNQMSEVALASLPKSTSMEVRDLNNRAVELAQAGLWPEAQITISQALALDDAQPTITWNALLIDLHADARAEQARAGQYPLLDNIFYGDYAAALELMRPYPVVEIFGPHSPLITGTIAEQWQTELADWIQQSTELALEAEPDLAAAFFLRAWATYLTEPDSRQVLDDLEQAATLAPDEPMFSQSLRYLSPTPTAAPTEVHPGQTTGVLAGQVTIGPLTPVEIQGRPTPSPPPEVYASRKILIFAEDGQTEISQVSIQPDGTYRVDLPAGTYVVDINRLGIDRAAGLPQTFKIVSQQVTRLDLDIDTGIR